MSDDEASELMQSFVDDWDKERGHSAGEKLLMDLLETKYPKTVKTFKSAGW